MSDFVPKPNAQCARRFEGASDIEEFVSRISERCIVLTRVVIPSAYSTGALYGELSNVKQCVTCFSLSGPITSVAWAVCMDPADHVIDVQRCVTGKCSAQLEWISCVGGGDAEHPPELIKFILLFAHSQMMPLILLTQSMSQPWLDRLGLRHWKHKTLQHWACRSLTLCFGLINFWYVWNQ